MKKLYNLLFMTAAIVLAACTNEQDDLFNDSSANRADAAIVANRNILTDASNGWLMEYYPEAYQGYGGYNVLVDFETDGTVKVASEFYSPEDVETSLFTVKQSAGIVLSFDTYNEIFHMFSDPSDPLGWGGSGYGLEGDYDYQILEATAEKVVLKGKKTGGIAVLTPMTQDWSEYIASIQESEAVMAANKLQLEINSTPIPVTISYRTLTFTYEEGGNSTSKTASYIVTPTGYKFYQPIEILGNEIEGFTYNVADDSFTTIGSVAATMLKIVPPINEQFVAGDWFIKFSTLGNFGQTYFNHVKTNFLDPMGEQLQYAFIGSMLYGSFGFNFNSSGYAGLLGLDYELIGEDKIALVFSFTGQGNGVWYHNNAGFSYLLNVFGYSAARVFTLTTDNIKNPSYVTLTEDGNPNNVITLFANTVMNPFDQ